MERMRSRRPARLPPPARRWASASRSFPGASCATRSCCSMRLFSWSARSSASCILLTCAWCSCIWLSASACAAAQHTSELSVHRAQVHCLAYCHMSQAKP